LGLTIATEGTSHAAIEARSMTAGAAAFFLYASCVSSMLMHYRFKALVVTLALTMWFAVSFTVLGLGIFL